MKAKTAILLALGFLVGGVALAAEEVWSGSRTIDAPVAMRGKSLRITPGTRIEFVGNGSLRIEDGGLDATQVVFSAHGTLTNNFRIAVQNGRVSLADCRFSGMKTFEPSKKNAAFIHGFLYCQFGIGSKVEHCDFIDCSPVMFLNSSRVEISRNLAVRCDCAFSFLNCVECRAEGNEFFNCANAAKVSGTRLSEFFRNRFTDCELGVLVYYCGENRFMGNAFFGGREGMRLWGLGKSGLFVGNRFESVRYPFAKREKQDPDNVFRDNEVLIR
jgi:nitrous oxidase accessory protein NosD